MNHSLRSLFTAAFLTCLACLASRDAGAVAAPTITGPYAAQVAELHTTAHLLQGADHDYKGHRARAVHEIHLAIHILHPVHKKHAPPTLKYANPKGGNNEPQAVSDAQLKQAIGQLHEVNRQLSFNAPPQAIAAIREAIHELHIALKIK